MFILFLNVGYVIVFLDVDGSQSDGELLELDAMARIELMHWALFFYSWNLLKGVGSYTRTSESYRWGHLGEEMICNSVTLQWYLLLRFDVVDGDAHKFWPR